MNNCINFISESHRVTYNGNSMLVENLTPDYTKEDRIRVKGNIERQLYSIFKKYS